MLAGSGPLPTALGAVRRDQPRASISCGLGTPAGWPRRGIPGSFPPKSPVTNRFRGILLCGFGYVNESVPGLKAIDLRSVVPVAIIPFVTPPMVAVPIGPPAMLLAPAAVILAFLHPLMRPVSGLVAISFALAPVLRPDPA